MHWKHRWDLVCFRERHRVHGSVVDAVVDAIVQAIESATGKTLDDFLRKPKEETKEAPQVVKKKRKVDFSKSRQRYIAFHVAYDGKRYNGFAAQAEEAGVYQAPLDDF